MLHAHHVATSDSAVQSPYGQHNQFAHKDLGRICRTSSQAQNLIATSLTSLPGAWKCRLQCPKKRAPKRSGPTELLANMSVVVVSGSAGLVGSEAARFYAELGCDVVGLDNDMRGYFFGASGSTRWRSDELCRTYPNYIHYDIDIRNQAAVEDLFLHYGDHIDLIIHTAAQPSHDWAAREPITDFTVNANGTLVLLESTRNVCPQATFIFTSTNKVYGDRPNELPLMELDTRWEIEPTHQYVSGIDETMSIDVTKHSLFGASKVAADVLVQEYARYFGLKAVCFRAGCITGPAHSSAELHGFLAYLFKCINERRSYTVIGHKGKQVRDNIHSFDLVQAFDHFHQNPRPGEVYNIGGGRQNSCSVLEAIARCEEISGIKLNWFYQEQHRIGDHIWWISDCRKFQSHYPNWSLRHDLDDILIEFQNGAQRR